MGYSTDRIETMLSTRSIKSHTPLTPSISLRRFQDNKVHRSLRHAFDSTLYHLNTIWLFPVNDIKTVVGPSTLFAVLHRFGRSSFNLKIQQDHSISETILLVLAVLGWTWINLLAFTIDNQRQPNAVEEDKLNKPWRPLPSNRLSNDMATTLLFVAYPLAIVVGDLLGAPARTIGLLFFGVWYNDFKGAETNWLIRNFLNACGIMLFNSGALQILLQQPVLDNPILHAWLAIIGCIILTTIHIQDMYDQVGDAQCNRKTIPLVIGDKAARWTIAIPVLCWSLFCPMFWSLSIVGYIVPLALGGLVARRTLTKTGVKQDKTTSKLWISTLR